MGKIYKNDEAVSIGLVEKLPVRVIKFREEKTKSGHEMLVYTLADAKGREIEHKLFMTPNGKKMAFSFADKCGIPNGAKSFDCEALLDCYCVISTYEDVFVYTDKAGNEQEKREIKVKFVEAYSGKSFEIGSSDDEELDLPF